MKMKWEKHGIKTPLARARGLGSARLGVEHWIALRVTSVATLFLSVWFVIFAKNAVGLNHEEFHDMLANPVNAIPMTLFIIAVFYHAKLGVQEVVEDYTHNEFLKVGRLLAVNLILYAAAIACLFSVFKIAF